MLAKKCELKVKRRVHVLTGGRHGVKILSTGLREKGVCDIHRERKEKAKVNRKMRRSVRDLEKTFV